MGLVCPKVPIYLVLLHYPVLNRQGDEVTTAVTNMDLHDISRSARTYGIEKYFVVTPIEDQHELLGRILGHWELKENRDFHPDRVQAVDLIQLVRRFEEVKEFVREKHGESPEVVMTSARPLPNAVAYADYQAELLDSSRTRPVVLVFGTGWGISETFFPEVDRILAPIYGSEGREGYNHLSVRSAVAIILDRLFGHK